MPHSVLFTKVLMVIGKVWEAVKPKALARYTVLKAERDAYESGADLTPEMQKSFSETYGRLLGGATEDSELNKRVAIVERAFFVPPHLKTPAIREWLSGSDVRAAFFEVAKGKCLQRQEDASLHENLAQSYSARTGERREMAGGAINVVVDGLVAGYRARFEDQSKLVVETVSAKVESVQQGLSQGIAGVHEHLNALSQDVAGNLGQAVEPLATAAVEQELDKILQVRLYEPATNQRIRALAERVRGGDLAGASHGAKQQVYLWATKILSSEDGTRGEATAYFDLVDKTHCKSDVSVVSAILLANDGRGDAALQVLRDVLSPDARAAMIFVLSKSQGFESAVSWYENLEPAPTFRDITPVGWCSLATAYSELGRWESAIEVLEKARPLAGQYADLLFIEGMYRAAMTVPAELRQQALEGSLMLGSVPQHEDDASEVWRSGSIELLRKAEIEIAPINERRAEFAFFTRMSLALRSKNDAVRLQAEEELSRLAVDKSQAVKLYPVLRQYDRQADKESLMSYLDVRETLGGLSEDEWVARFFLALDILGRPEDAPKLLDFLERHRSGLSRVIQPRALTSVRIKALLASDGQAIRAREELESNRSVFSADHAAQLEAEIAATEGEDIRPRLERIYTESPTIVNLHLLVEHLLKVQDFVALEPKARELYQLERALPNARIVVACLSHRTNLDPREMVEFLEAEHDVVGNDLELKSQLAWSLLQCGEWKKARALNDELLVAQPNAESHVGLDINIAIKSGDWEHFATIFDREWPRKNNHSPRTLLLLAQLANDGHVPTEKAFELVRLAAEKASDSAPALVAAYNAAVTLGREDELSAAWLHHAAATDTSGVIKRIPVRELTEEILPSLQKRNESLLDHLQKSTAPIQLIASVLKMPIARLYCAIPSANERQTDARKRVVLPFFGARLEKSTLANCDPIGFDITSILTLTTLGLFDRALEFFQRVHIAPDTLELLLVESRHMRFRQPSELQLAHSILAALRRLTLRTVEDGYQPPDWLIQEVGPRLAQLLESAKTTQGFVITAFPVFRVGSLNEAPANLREYQGYVVSCQTYIDLLLRTGKIAQAIAENAASKITLMDSGPKTQLPTASHDTLFYVDDVAIRYLHRSGTLEAVAQAGLTLRCSPGLKDDHEQLEAEADERESLVEIIDSARSALRRALEAGKVSLIAERPRSEKLRALRDGEAETLPTLLAFLQAGHPVENLVIDDRYFTRIPGFEDELGKLIHTYSTLDVIDSMISEGFLSPAEGAHARHRLRLRGATYINVDGGELAGMLDACGVGSSSLLRESYEVRTLRQSLTHACALDTGSVQDRQFLQSISTALVDTIARSWETADVAPDRAVALTRWALDGLGRPLWTAVGNGQNNPRAAALEMAAVTISGLLLKATFWQRDRRMKFQELLDDELLQPAVYANRDLLGRITALIQVQLDAFKALKDELDADSKQQLHIFVALLPSRIRDYLQNEPSMSDLVSETVEHAVQFGTHSFTVSALYQAARRTAEDGLNEFDGCRMRLESETILAELLEDGTWMGLPFPELAGLMKDEAARLAAVRQAVSELGPTFTDGERIIASVSNDILAERDFDLLLEERINGVKARWLRIRGERERPPELSTLVPDSTRYYAALLGPVERSLGFPEYAAETLLPYRTRLIERDLIEGLRIACLGFFDIILAPSRLVQHVENDELWFAVQSLKELGDPYTLLGLAEIGIVRASDPRFVQLARDCIERLCKEDMAGAHLFAAAALFNRLALSEIQTLDDAALVQPHWKRMAARMQAGVILQGYGNQNFIMPALESWVAEHLQPTRVAAEVMDLHVDPYYAASLNTAEAIWDNVFKLLVTVGGNAADGVLSDKLENRIKELVNRRLSQNFASFHTAGPCGNMRNRQEAKLTPAETSNARERLAESPFSPVWSALVATSQVIHVESEIYEAGMNGLRELTLAADDVDWDNKLRCVADVALLALIEADVELAEVVRDFLFRVAGAATSDIRLMALMHALFIAAGAFRDAEKRATVIEEATKNLSLLFSAGGLSRMAAEAFRACSNLRRWYSGPASWAELYALSAG
ncbi:hypothetical protein [Burkholderia sp. BCC1993]|uniref:tetratricopeptide repeat protein n=1 Tax=Burkholderia sp. BCC1993 TaxID=2817444 RepID=UPI002AAF46C9|nr:hypothetical protein [Burkholderia sp. BCC1993]